MRRSLVVIACGLSFSVGIVVNVMLDAWPGQKPAEARTLDPKLVEGLYAELGGSDNSLINTSRMLAKIARLTSPSVVHIQARRQENRGKVEETGSGVIVRDDRETAFFVVTNRHVIHGAERHDISIHLHDGRILLPVQIWSDKATDIAVMKLKQTDLDAARWSDSDEIEIGHMVLAMGSPFGLSQSITYGIISAKGRRSLKLGATSDVLNQDFLQTDAAINPGNSGGPLIDMSGRVVGINTAIASNSGGNEGIGFSIPSNIASRVADELIRHGRVQRAYLGVKLDPAFTNGVARRLKLERAQGARVLEVYPGTPAARAKLRPDDVVLEFNGREVQDENDLINLVSLMPVNSRVTLEVFRNGKRINVDVSLGDRETLLQQASAPTKPDMGIDVRSMGVRVHTLEAQVARQLGYDARRGGVLVLHVEEDSPLSDRIKVYDVIESIGRTPVRSASELQRLIQLSERLPKLSLKVRRAKNGGEQTSIVVWERS